MNGAFIGDIVGSRFEWTGFREKEFDLFAEGCRVTDDSLMTAAVAEAFLTMRETGLMAAAGMERPCAFLRLAGLPTPWRKPRNWLLFPAV